MKILWVKAGGLVPPDTGGKIRSYQILKELARRHAVTLFTFYAATPDDAHSQLAPLFVRVVRIPLRLPRPLSLANALHYVRCFLSRQPYALGRYCQPEVAKQLCQLLREETYDVIVCDFLAAAGVIPWELPCPKILFTHNVEALIWLRHCRLTRNPLWKALCWREYRAMARAERHYLEQADHVLTVSDADRDILARLKDPPHFTVIPTGVDVDYFRPAPGAEQSNTLVFTGSMDWLPNEDAVFYFVREILPRVRRDVPGATLWVVGRRPSQRLRALARENSSLRLTGTVEDIRPYVHRASVYIVPLRIGSGTRLKIFEALAMGKAVVSTTVGAEGLPVQSGENILLADDPEEFARIVVALLREPWRREQIGRAARELVEERFSWAAVTDHLEAALAQVAGKVQPALAAQPIEASPGEAKIPVLRERPLAEPPF